MNMWQKLMLLVIACLFSAAPAQGAWSIIDDFQSETLGHINGLEELNATTFLFGNVLDAVITIGAIDNAGLYPFNGAMDDVAIYNYALSMTEVATLYSAFHGPYCVAYPECDFDLSCAVDLVDFAIFAAQWLDCNIFPTCITAVP